MSNGDNDELEKDREFLKGLGQKYVENPEGFDKIVTPAATDRVLAVLNSHREKMDVQLSGCTVLLGIASVCKDRGTADKLIAGLLDAIDASPSSLPLLKVTLSALSLVTVSESGRAALSGSQTVLKRTVQIVTRSMKTIQGREDARSSDAAEALQGAYSTLTNASAAGGNAQDIILAEGGLDAMYSAADAFVDDAGTQRGVVVLICNYLDDAKNIAPIALERRGIERVCCALAHGSSDLVVLKVGFTALLKAMSLPACRERVVAAGGVELVLVGMVGHQDEAEILATGCSVLACVAMQPQFKPLVAQKGGLAAVTIAMKKHPKDAVVQRNGCIALMALTTNAENQRNAAQKYNAVDLAVAALKNHKDDPHVICYAAGTLGNVAACADNVPLVTDNASHALGLITAAMKKHADNPDVQQRCTSALCNISIHCAADRATMYSGGAALEAVLNAMARHASVPRVIVSGCQFLGNISRDDHEQTLPLPNTRVMAALVDALEKHAEVPPVLAAAISTIANYSLNPANTTAIAESPAATLIVNAMHRFPDAADVQAYGILAFANLLAAPVFFDLAFPKTAFEEDSAFGLVLAAIRRHCDAREVLGNAVIFTRTLLKNHSDTLPSYAREKLAQNIGVKANADNAAFIEAISDFASHATH